MIMHKNIKNQKSNMISLPLVSIIIVNYNGKKYLEKCLDSLKKITHSNIEIILVDNNSTDDSIEFVKNEYPKVIIIKLDRNYGFAEPNNIGAKNSKGDYLLFLNNDTEVTPNFITELLEGADKDPKIAICQSLLLKPNGDVDSAGDFVTKQGRAFSSKNSHLNKPIPILSARGAAMIIKKNKFNELGGFDSDYVLSFEDVEIGWKAWILGYQVKVIPSSIVYHHGAGTIKQLGPTVTFHGLKNLLSLVTTHYETSLVGWKIFQTFAYLTGRFLGVISSNEKNSTYFTVDKKNAMKAIFWYIKNFRMIWNKHKALNLKRIKSTKDLEKIGVITSKKESAT